MIIAAITATAVLAGCQRSATDQTKSQTVVRVNGDEITTHQISFALSRMNAGPADEAKTREVAEQFVDQQLLLQKAMENGLQRDANVMRALEQTRREVLAQAYLDRAVGHAPPPSSAEIEEYYRKHPELFAQRRQYELQQLTVDKTLPLNELERQVYASSSISDLGKRLQAKGALLERENVSLPAEKIDLELLPKLYRMKPGERVVLDKPDQHLVVALVASELQPMSASEATPFIEQYLVAAQREERGLQELKRLRALAHIEWVGDFSRKPTTVTEDGATAQAVQTNVNHRVE
jgi:EpsD family peptidyl-prolyl cis-trans isomerase